MRTVRARQANQKFSALLREVEVRVAQFTSGSVR